MPALRMTPARLDLLRAVKAGKVKVDVLSADRHVFRTDKSGWPTVTHAYHLLHQERLVAYGEREPGRRTVTPEVTPAGEKILATYEEPTDG